ncbi:MAG: cysteine desulfurase [Clostridia bacterium]|nr:cysteine desulfurase [Clostridia bacterium]
MLYFDNAATTKISKTSLDAYVNASECFFNPSSLYAESAKAKALIEESRNYILKQLKAKPKSTIIFTGSATESNNAVLNAHITRKDKKYVFSAGEHSAIYETAKKYQENGYNIVFVPLNKNGSVNVDALMKEIDNTVVLVSIIYVSNETGAINDIKEITSQIKEINKNIIVHTDGVQAVAKLEINLKDLDVDYFTMSAHKINGPKGIGALYIAEPNKFKPFIIGGGQEMSLRSGTENIPAICAFRQAIQDIKIKDYSKHKQAILDNLQGDYRMVSNSKCIDNIISICFKGVRGETILHMLEAKGYLVGTGSACNSKAGHNRVLSSIVPNDYIEGAIRISFGEDISIEDCVNLAVELSNAVKLYRERINR